MFYDKTYEEPWNAFFFRAENRCEQCAFFWSRKFAAAVLFASEILFSQFFRQSERLICAVAVKGIFLGILLQKGFLIQIRFRGQFSGEIFINLS